MSDQILVTGAAGFIGYHVCERLLAGGSKVVGVDNVDDYYSVRLKEERLKRLGRHSRFSFRKIDLHEPGLLSEVFDETPINRVIHLAAQAGVRHSITNPLKYIDSNIIAFVNVLEACRHNAVDHLVFASSSSVYGSNPPPWSISDRVDHPLSLYAATKKANELLAHSYAHLYGLPTTGLRFFTVYGPWGRPDSAYYLFTDAIVNNRPIKVFNHGQMQRDFTYIDDIVECVERIVLQAPEPYSGQGEPGPGRSRTGPFRLYNIGNDSPVTLLEFIEIIEGHIGKSAEKIMLPMQLGDVPASHANVDSLALDFGFKPKTNLHDGLRTFVDWYAAYHDKI